MAEVCANVCVWTAVVLYFVSVFEKDIQSLYVCLHTVCAHMKTQKTSLWSRLIFPHSHTALNNSSSSQVLHPFPSPSLPPLSLTNKQDGSQSQTSEAITIPCSKSLLARLWPCFVSSELSGLLLAVRVTACNHVLVTMTLLSSLTGGLRKKERARRL